MDDIIAKGPFMGCENDAKAGATPAQLGVAPGLGLGVNPGLGLYGEILDIYKDKHYILPDGTLSFETVVDITTKLLCLKGMVNSKNIQFLEGVFIYPKEYFCPIDFKTSVCTITPNTHTIHHYSATWLPWYMKLEGNIWQAFGLGKQFYFTRLANKIMRIFK